MSILSILGSGESMVLTQIKNGFHMRRMKKTGEIFQAQKLGFAFYILKSANGEFLGRHLAKVVEELSEVVDGSST